jgi:dienelactone hydrolase
MLPALTSSSRAPVPSRGWRAAVLALGLWLVGLTLAPALAAPQPASAEPLEVDLHEQVLTIPASGPLVPELEVTLYRPRGSGPFPLAVINHGRSPGPAHMQARYRPLHVAYELVRRGYAVVVPMREGFSRSGGVELDGSCDLTLNGRQQARSVRRAVDWAAAQAWADAEQIIVLGQSHGGLATLAYGENPHPGTRLLVNFAGGLRQPGCPDWEDALVEAIAGYARSTRLPSLWFYGDNDSHFRTPVWRAAHERYIRQGAPADLRAFGHFGTDAHALFGAREGLAVWLPPLLEALEGKGLPARIEARFEPMPDLPERLPVRKVQADEADRLPVRGPSARQGFLAWLRLNVPKAFAVSENGRHWASAWGVARPVAHALEQCEKLSGVRCRLFAFNGFVVWSGDSGTD